MYIKDSIWHLHLLSTVDRFIKVLKYVYLSDTQIYLTLKNLSVNNECNCQIILSLMLSTIVSTMLFSIDEAMLLMFMVVETGRENNIDRTSLIVIIVAQPC